MGQTVDARNGATTCGYNAADLVQTVITPNPDGTGCPAVAQTNITYYDKSLRATNAVEADGTSKFTEFPLHGLPKKIWGSRGCAWQVRAQAGFCSGWSAHSCEIWPKHFDTARRHDKPTLRDFRL